MPVKALFFDVFGTCVDWRSSVTREGELLGRQLRLGDVEWNRFADAWRALYQPQMETVRNGQRPWTTLDVLHREALDRVLAGFGLDAVPEKHRVALNLAWHRLDPWPDVVPGLHRLKQRFVIAPNSNGNIALIVDMAKRAGLPWDVVLGAETARAYKPLPAAYLKNVELLGLRPEEVMMVAAHNNDLIAAKSCGLQTAFIPRPTEHGPNQTTDLVADPSVDLIASDFIELCERLSIRS